MIQVNVFSVPKMINHYCAKNCKKCLFSYILSLDFQAGPRKKSVAVHKYIGLFHPPDQNRICGCQKIWTRLKGETTFWKYLKWILFAYLSTSLCIVLISFEIWEMRDLFILLGKQWKHIYSYCTLIFRVT